MKELILGGQLGLNNSYNAIITVKGVHYCCIIHDMSKSLVIYLLGNSVLHDIE